MNRDTAIKFCRDKLNEHGLSHWHIRTAAHMHILGLCDHKTETIFLSIHHLDTHPEPEVENTILHEIAHALVSPGHAHDEVWQAKAREIGCTSVNAVSHLSFSPEMIDAVRSGATVEVTFETEVIHRPKYKVTRIQDKCEFCGKVAKLLRETTVEGEEYDRKFMFLECGHLIVKKIPKGTRFDSLVSNWWKPEVAECKHEWAKNKCLNCGEFKLFPFQVEGARFVEAALSVNKGAGIFDEMGLGKTVQDLAVLKFHPELTPTLFIVKSSLKFQWFKEILRWCGPEFLAQIINTSNDYLIPGLKAYIISYDMLVPKERNGKNGKKIKQGFDGERFKELGIKLVVLDECQQIKNPDATRTQEVRKICKDTKVIPLSGTPWKNRGSEFFTVLNMIHPTKFWSYQHFIDRWVSTCFNGKYMKQGGIRNVEAFREYVKDIVIRREVNDVMKELPEANRSLFYVELDKIEQKSYDDEVSEFVRWYNDAEANDELNSFEAGTNILAKLARMRHITGLAKIEASVDFAKEFIENTGRKLTIFVHHKDVGEILYTRCKEELDVPVFKLTAEQDALTRFQTQEEFNKTPCCILIASTLASGEGINLQTCGDAIMHERQWNPANEDQAAPGRFRRIGSEFKVVNVIFMTASGTIDEILAGIVANKAAEFHRSMNKGDMPVWTETSMAKELAAGIVKMHESKKKG